MPNIAVAILAAGSSSRMGKPKQALRFGGKTLMQHAIDQACGTTCSLVFVVVQPEQALDGNPNSSRVGFLPNPDYALGMSTSVRIAVSAAHREPEIDGLLLMNCDQPGVDSAALQQLIDRFRTETIVASVFGGTVGSPALFDKGFFSSLVAVQGDRGAKSIILQNRKSLIEVAMPSALLDIDTPEDFETLSHSIGDVT
jgi:molybdenum cofactor cytidylyltransferase